MSNLKAMALLLSMVFLGSIASADYYYYERSGNSITQDTGFAAPEFESHQQVLTELVAPFIFLSILLQIGFSRALRFAFVDENQNRTLLDLERQNEPAVNRKAMIMAITVTAMLVPTPFWSYIRLLTGFIGIGAITLVAVALAYFGYLWLRG